MKQKAINTTPPAPLRPRDTRVGVTIRELADELGVAYQSVQRFIEPGGMPVMRWEVIRGRRYARLDLDECVR